MLRYILFLVSILTCSSASAATYVVERGDTLSHIANRFGTSVDTIVRDNGIADPDLILVGQTLDISTTAPEKSVFQKQSLYPEPTAKAAPRDKRKASSGHAPSYRIAQKKHRGASRHPESALRRAAAIVKAYDPIVEKASRDYQVPKQFIYALIYHESGGNPYAIGDGGRSRGLMQLHDPTREKLGLSKKDAHDPAKAIPAGARYLREQYDLFGKDPVAAISAYNAPYLTQKMIARGSDPSSRAYVRKVKAAMKLFTEYHRAGQA